MRMLTVATIVVAAFSLAQAGERTLNPYTPGENGVTAPKVIADSATAIPLPEGQGAGAVLTVSAVVRKDGSVAEVRVIDSSLKGAGLEESAAATVRGWRFEPGTWRGMPVDTVKTMKIYLGGEAAAAAAASSQPVVAEIRLPAFDPLFTSLRLPGERGPRTQYPDVDPQYRKPAVVDKTTCAFGEHCLHEKTPGTTEPTRLVSMPTVPASQK